MKRFAAYALSFVVSLVFILALLMTCVDLTARDESFFRTEYRKLSRPSAIGMGEEELMRVTQHLVRYMRGQEEDLVITAEIGGREREVFGKRDREHMVDVRNLYVFFLNFSRVGWGLAVLTIALVIVTMRREATRVLVRSFFAASGVFALIVVVMGAWMSLDFTSFWTAFHLLFFTNDLWLLDPATSVLIQMVPEQFFFDIIAEILRRFALAVGATLLLCVGNVIYRAWKRRVLMAIPQQDEEEASYEPYLAEFYTGVDGELKEGMPRKEEGGKGEPWNT